MPIREGILHLSAPGIYGLAVEALTLSEGLSFLNVGSGTGYVSAVAAQLLGSRSIHWGIELQPKVRGVRARACARIFSPLAARASVGRVLAR